ncbi:MAG: PIN domain-containing protein [Planctomycetota bacterium]
MKHAVVDTDVVSYAFSGGDRYEPFRPILSGVVPFISFMTYAELRHGALNRGWGNRRTEELLRFIAANFAIVQSDQDVADAWARLRNDATRNGRVLSSADGWIAATASAHDLPLITNNLKDFRDLDRLVVLSPR